MGAQAKTNKVAINLDLGQTVVDFIRGKEMETITDEMEETMWESFHKDSEAWEPTGLPRTNFILNFIGLTDYSAALYYFINILNYY